MSLDGSSNNVEPAASPFTGNPRGSVLETASIEEKEEMLPPAQHSPCNSFAQHFESTSSIFQEIWTSSEMLFQTKLSWLLILGPIALFGDATGFLGEASCFALSGIALIPCAERLSYVTEQVAEHTNGTIGALLNATFGNAPELLIATAALRSGFYRVVQLAMLGSMLTNLLLVFGMSCLVGGLRWQVQELRITSGNVSVGMLLLSTAASLLPAALVLSGQLPVHDNDDDGKTDQTDQTDQNNHRVERTPSAEELAFCRVNAFVMVILYVSYLIFQLGTHKEEFDAEENVVEAACGEPLHLAPQFTARHGRQASSSRNLFCMNFYAQLSGNCGNSNSSIARNTGGVREGGLSSGVATTIELEMPRRNLPSKNRGTDGTYQVLNGQGEADVDGIGGIRMIDCEDHSSLSSSGSLNELGMGGLSSDNGGLGGTNAAAARRRRRRESRRQDKRGDFHLISDPLNTSTVQKMRHRQQPSVEYDPLPRHIEQPPTTIVEQPHEAQMSLRAGIVWLLIITLCISAMSDILVDTIDGFALRIQIGQVFTSMVIVPFFSNVAEQVSAILFAYRNEMDLCVGVTVGSAIQVATFVLPGCVLIGMFVDRSMTLYFHGYETACLFLAVVVVAAVLQGGTTNWLVGMTLIGIYIMIATGFWFHELEDLSVDEELMYIASSTTASALNATDTIGDNF